jgi:hypothetical protein
VNFYRRYIDLEGNKIKEREALDKETISRAQGLIEQGASCKEKPLKES